MHARTHARGRERMRPDSYAARGDARAHACTQARTHTHASTHACESLGSRPELLFQSRWALSCVTAWPKVQGMLHMSWYWGWGISFHRGLVRPGATGLPCSCYSKRPVVYELGLCPGPGALAPQMFLAILGLWALRCQPSRDLPARTLLRGYLWCLCRHLTYCYIEQESAECRSHLQCVRRPRLTPCSWSPRLTLCASRQVT